MRARPAPLFVAAVLAAGCALGVPPVAGPSTKPATSSVKASAKPAVKASVKPAKKPPKLPERVNLLLPPALGMVAAGSGNLIGLDGASLIGNDAGSLVAAGAGNLIGPDGASLVAAGGGNAVKPATSSFRLAQQADCPPPAATGAIAFKELVAANMDVYVESVVLVNRVLRQVREAGIVPDEPLTLERADGGGKFTALLRSGGEESGEGGVLLVSEGETLTRDKLFLGMSFASATSGRVVTRPPGVHDTYGRVAFATTFDLATGSATADGTGHKTAEPNAKIRAHWEFRAARQPAAGAPHFSAQVAANFLFPTYPCESGARVMSIHYGADGRGAARMGRVEPGKADLTYTRNDGQGYAADAGPDTAFYIEKTGDPMNAATADEALKALVPGKDQIYRPFPAAPGPGDPLADPLFAFPE